jgi:hypothetical protein
VTSIVAEIDAALESYVFDDEYWEKTNIICRVETNDRTFRLFTDRALNYRASRYGVYVRPMISVHGDPDDLEWSSQAATCFASCTTCLDVAYTGDCDDHK